MKAYKTLCFAFTFFLLAGAGCSTDVNINKNAALESEKQFQTSNIGSFNQSELEMFTQAQTLQAENKHEQAIEIFKKLVEANNAEPNVWSDMAVSYEALGMADNAMDAYKNAVDSAEKDPLYADGVDFLIDHIQYCERAYAVTTCTDAYKKILKKSDTLATEQEKINVGNLLENSVGILAEYGETALSNEAQTKSTQLLSSVSWK